MLTSYCSTTIDHPTNLAVKVPSRTYQKNLLVFELQLQMSIPGNELLDLLRVHLLLLLQGLQLSLGGGKLLLQVIKSLRS